MKIILLSAKQGGGKTTLQKALAERWFKRTGQGAICLNFADIIYEMHDEVLKVLHRYWPDRGLAKDGPLLQLLGTNWGRQTIDPDVWVKCLKKRVEMWSRESADGLVIVGDCRFENEIECFEEAMRVRLHAPRDVRKQRCSMWRENEDHPSEVGLDHYSKFDLYLDTHKTPVDGCVSLIMVLLDKPWVERRR